MTDHEDKLKDVQVQLKRRKVGDDILDERVEYARKVVSDSRSQRVREGISLGMHRAIVTCFAIIGAAAVYLTSPFSPYARVWPHAGIVFVTIAFVLLVAGAATLIAVNRSRA